MPEKQETLDPILLQVCGEEDKTQSSSNLTPRLVICTANEPFKQVIRSSMVD